MFALDLVLAVVWLHRVWFGPGLGHRLVGGATDPEMFAWYLAWVPHAVGSGLNPFVTHVVAAPAGANLMWSTSVLLPAFVLSPVTLLFGPFVAYDVAVTAGITLNAFVAFLAFRRFCRRPSAAVVGSLLYGFSPFVAGQLLGHVNLVILAFPPLVLLLLHELLIRRRWNRWLCAGALGAASAAQMLISEEVLALTAVVTAAVLVVTSPDWGRGEHAIRRAISTLLVAGAVGTLLCCYPLWLQFRGPRRVVGRLQPPNRCVTDLVALARPSGRQLLSSSASASRIAKLSCFGGESASYLGLPLIVLLAVGVVVLIRRPPVRAAAWCLIIALVASAGPSLHVGGRDTGIVMPWRLLANLPLLRDVLPDRFMIFVFLGAGWIISQVLDEVLAMEPARLRRLGSVVVAVPLVALVPGSPPVTRVAIPAFFTSKGVRILRGREALVLPLDDHGYSAMAWQSAANFSFSMPEGAVFIPGPSFAPLQTSELFGVVRTIEGVGAPDQLPSCGLIRHGSTILAGGCKVMFLAELHTDLVGIVVAGPVTADERAFFTDLLGSAPTTTDDISIWRPPQGKSAW